MRSVWVTGAHGFLGRNLCRCMARNGFRVVAIGHGEWAAGEPAEWGIHTWECSNINLPALERLEAKTAKPYAIFHAAGSGSVPMSVIDPRRDFHRTVGTTLDVLEYIRLKSPKTKCIYPSSAAVYGSVPKGRIKEDTPMNPVSPYGAHKQMTEILCQTYSSHFGTSVAILRFFSLYGPGLKKQLLWDLCSKLETADGEIPLYGTGDETRDWLHVDDAVELLLLALENASPDIYPVNGGTGIGTTVRDVAEGIQALFGTEGRIAFQGIFREGDPRFFLADMARAESWGFRPGRDLREGIKEYVKWFKNLRDIG
jgi:UDP-glucose 4-epimerase